MSDKFDRGTYVSYYWEGNVTENEAVFPLESREGICPDIPLMYPADEIIEVRSSDLGTLYMEGKDYILENEKLRILKDGDIPTVPHKEFFIAEKPAEGPSFSCRFGGYIFFAEAAEMHKRQIAVTYRHSAPWQGFVPAAQGAELPKTLAKLEAGEKLKVLVYGDSISTGANSSGRVGAEPFAEPWYDMLCGTLRERYNSEIELTNTAVGGTSARWGLENVEELAAAHTPDLAILGFGMNDGSGRVSVEQYIDRMQKIIEAIRAKNPDTEFILISTMMPHAIVDRFLGNQEAYLPALLGLVETGCVVANVTDAHKALLARKRYYDMSGNNVNHPNDFLARLYAQVLLRTMEK